MRGQVFPAMSPRTCEVAGHKGFPFRSAKRFAFPSPLGCAGESSDQGIAGIPARRITGYIRPGGSPSSPGQAAAPPTAIPSLPDHCRGGLRWWVPRRGIGSVGRCDFDAHRPTATPLVATPELALPHNLRARHPFPRAPRPVPAEPDRPAGGPRAPAAPCSRTTRGLRRPVHAGRRGCPVGLRRVAGPACSSRRDLHDQNGCFRSMLGGIP